MAQLTLRPNADVSGFTPTGQAAGSGSTWDVYVNSAFVAGGAGWSVIDDVVTQPNAADTTDYIAFSQSGPGTSIVDLTTASIPAGEVVTSIVGWIYYRNTGGTSRNLQYDVRKADGTVLATANFNAAQTAYGWSSITFTGSVTQAELDGLRLAFVGTNTLDTNLVAAAYVDVMTSVPVQAGVSASIVAGQQVRTYNQAGTFQFVVPSGVYAIKAEVQGGGGGGGGGSVGVGGGASGGAYSRIDSMAVVPGQVITVIVGAGGTAGASAAAGGVGGDSSIGSTATLLAKGGTAGGAGGVGNGTGGTAPAATASIGGTKFVGGNGGVSAGGGGAGSTGAGGNANANTAGAAGTPDGGAGGAGPAGVPVAPGGGGAGGGALAAGSAGAIGRAKITFTEAVQMTTVASFAQAETLSQSQTLTTTGVLVQSDALSQDVALTSASVLSSSHALAQDQTLTSVAALSQADALAVIADLVTSAALSQSEALAQESTLVSTAVLSAAEALAQAQTLTSITDLTQNASLADTVALVTAAALSQNWKLVAAGLDGIAWDKGRTVPQANVEVIVFRDDTNLPVFTTTTSDDGAWYTPLDSRYTYWVSYWRAEGPGGDDDIMARTAKGIPTKDTIIATGT